VSPSRRVGGVALAIFWSSIPASIAGGCAPVDRSADEAPATSPSTDGDRPRVDTVVRVDTVLIVDTVVALGPAADSLARESAATSSGARAPTDQDMLYLRSRRLIVPVAGVSASAIPSSFSDVRGGTRQHNAIDILAPRGTPVLAADAGTIAKVDTSAGGGLSLYVADPRERFIYYYAHLDGYRRGIREGLRVEKGDTIGYVGTTGNAPPGTPHLHFAIALADEDRRWWKGTPLDPLPLLLDAERR
jgi:murein DD-endopeptidase MepM/ murein hydrolase activator NlpD